MGMQISLRNPTFNSFWYALKSEISADHQPRLDAWDKRSDLVHWEDLEGAGGEGGGRGVGGSGWGTHVNPWLFHFNVWQNSLQIKKKVRFLDPMVMLLYTWGNGHTVFHTFYTMLHSHQQCRVLISAYPLQHLLFSVVLIVAILICVRGYLIVVDLHVSNEKWCWASFHVLIGHLYIIFGGKYLDNIHFFTLCLFKG